MIRLEKPTTLGFRDSTRTSEYSGAILERLNGILKGDQPNQQQLITQELDGFDIRDVTIRKYFLQFPEAWYSLKRKIHTLRQKYGREYAQYLESELLPIFLRRGRTSDIGRDIRSAFIPSIVENQRLLSTATQEISLLDTSHLDIQNHPGSLDEKIGFIQHWIEKGILQNAEDPDMIIKNPQRFRGFTRKLLRMLRRVFGIDLDSILDETTTLYTLSTKIAQMIWRERSGNGNHGGKESRNAWMLVKSYHAWGAIDKIEQLHELSEELVENMPTKLSEAQIRVTQVRKHRKRTSKNGMEEIQIHYTAKGETDVNGKSVSFDLTYRAKSVSSILIKMWENEDYTTEDAIRDLVGGAFIISDESIHGTQAEREEWKKMVLELKYKQMMLMSDFGYISKSKDLITAKEAAGVKSRASKNGRSPMTTQTTRSSTKSSKGFINSSETGYASFPHPNRDEKTPIGTELQLMTVSGANFWMSDHAAYDPRKIISATIRGSCITLDQIIAIYMQELGLETHIDIITNYINSSIGSFLLPCTINGNELVFTTTEHKDAFLGKFKDGRIINSSDYELVKYYIQSQNDPESQLGGL